MATDLYSVQVNSTDTPPTFVIPNGFITASIVPINSGTYTITNSIGVTGITYSDNTTIPEKMDISPYPTHTVTVLTGSVQISYTRTT